MSSVAVALCLHLCCTYFNAVPLLYVVIPDLCVLVGVGRPCNSDCRFTWSLSSPAFLLDWHPVGPVGFPAPLGRCPIAFYAALLFVVENCRYVIFFPSAFVDYLARLSGSNTGTPSPFLCPSVPPARSWTSVFAAMPRRIAPLPFAPFFFSHVVMVPVFSICLPIAADWDRSGFSGPTCLHSGWQCLWGPCLLMCPWNVKFCCP